MSLLKCDARHEEIAYEAGPAGRPARLCPLCEAIDRIDQLNARINGLELTIES